MTTDPVDQATPELVWNAKAQLGEGPVWSADDRCVWFVDIKGRKLHRYGVEDETKRSWPMPDQIGFAVPADDGSLVCGLKGGLHRFDAATGAFDLILPVEPDRPDNRLNDGFVAPDGSLWFGSMHDAETEKTGVLYRFADGRLENVDEGYCVTNGPAMSPDGSTLYHHDTLDRAIYAFDHQDGRLTNKRLFARTEEGFADGPSVDSEGVLHVGLYGGGRVARFGPDGKPLAPIMMPVANVTKAAFGGDDLCDLYVTTAWAGLKLAERREQSGAGGLYRVRVDTPGLPQARVKLYA